MPLKAKTMEDGKILNCTIKESSGIMGATCTESMVRNWRDLALHSDSCKEDTYKSGDEIVILQKKEDWYLTLRFTIWYRNMKQLKIRCRYTGELMVKLKRLGLGHLSY